MKVTELTREQLAELKRNYLIETRDGVSWGELADADELVPDALVFEVYAGTDFVPDDFFAK